MRNNEEYIMAKKISFGEGLLIAIAAIGGLFLFADYYKKHTLKKVYYRCPKCGARIVEDESPCHNCNTILKWTE
jgi:DNA-directed RNA polymerase subunit RPC12/RpoP